MDLYVAKNCSVSITVKFFSYAKHLIEDTIRRNASPIRETIGVVGAGSCSSLTSSNSDETHARINRNTVMTGNHQKGRNQIGNILLHSLSTNDASVGEYKFTVNVGQHNIKITGDSLDLVRVSVIYFVCIVIFVLRNPRVCLL